MTAFPATPENATVAGARVASTPSIRRAVPIAAYHRTCLTAPAAAVTLAVSLVFATPAAAATVHPVTAAELGATWRPGCPVGPEALRRVELEFVGLDDRTHNGELVVHRDVVADVMAVFGHLEQMRYPIARMQTADHYPGADDQLSMADNNSSAFNCRDIPGTGRWSPHAYGRAVDINPLFNPYVRRDGAFEPANAGAYTDRGRTDPGVLHDGDPAVRAFTDRGWAWGGYWRRHKDYQHFERP
jgi:hypothetical protein